MNLAIFLAFLRHLVQNIVSVLNKFPSVRNTLHRLLHFKVHETQVLLLSGLVVGVGAGLGAIVFRELISGFTFLFFNVLRPTLSTLLGPYAIIFIPAIGGLIFGPLIFFFAREAKGHGVPEVMLAVAQKGGGFAPSWRPSNRSLLRSVSALVARWGVRDQSSRSVQLSALPGDNSFICRKHAPARLLPVVPRVA